MLLMGRSKVPSYTEFLPKEGDPTGVECINCGWSTCAKKGNKQCDHIGLDCLEASPSKREECVRWRVNRPSQDKKSSCNGRAQVAMEGIQKERELKRGAEKEVRLAELHHQELTEQRTAENEVQVQRVELELKHQEKMRRIEGQERTRLAEIDANTFTTQMGAVLTNQAKAEQEQTTRNACTTAALVAASSNRESADTKCKQQATPAAARKLQLYAWLEEQELEELFELLCENGFNSIKRVLKMATLLPLILLPLILLPLTLLPFTLLPLILLPLILLPPTLLPLILLPLILLPLILLPLTLLPLILLPLILLPLTLLPPTLLPLILLPPTLLPLTLLPLTLLSPTLLPHCLSHCLPHCLPLGCSQV
jgi:hypothetical protein